MTSEHLCQQRSGATHCCLTHTSPHHGNLLGQDRTLTDWTLALLFLSDTSRPLNSSRAACREDAALRSRMLYIIAAAAGHQRSYPTASLASGAVQPTTQARQALVRPRQSWDSVCRVWIRRGRGRVPVCCGSCCCSRCVRCWLSALLVARSSFNSSSSCEQDGASAVLRRSCVEVLCVLRDKHDTVCWLS